MEKGGYIYILTNTRNKVLYIGVTSNLSAKIFEHKTNVYKNSFTARYNVHKLIYFETFDNIEEAIQREYQLKNWKRVWKIDLIKRINPLFEDLYEKIKDEYM